MVRDKWACFARTIYLYFVALNVLSLVSQTLALCTSLDGERCTGVVYLFVIPVPIENMPAIIGDAAYATTLLLSLFLLCRELTTSRILGKTARQTLFHALPEMLLCFLQWLSLAFRFTLDTLPINRLLLGMAACLGWIRFMRTFFVISPQLGPKFRMIQRMLLGDVAQWLALYLCFFCACQALLLGVMLYDHPGGVRSVGEVHGGSEVRTVLYVAKVLFEMTVNPNTLIMEDAIGGWPGIWEPAPTLSGWLEAGFTWACLLLWAVLGNIVLLNLLIAMMGNTYVEVLHKSESEWRLSFCKLVLFQEATPRVFFPPLKSMDRRNRPPNHVRGTLDVLRPTGARAKVECWFLHVELSTAAAEMVTAASTSSNPPYHARAMPHRTLHSRMSNFRPAPQPPSSPRIPKKASLSCRSRIRSPPSSIGGSARCRRCWRTYRSKPESRKGVRRMRQPRQRLTGTLMWRPL